MILEIEDIIGNRKALGHIALPPDLTLGEIFDGDDKLKNINIVSARYNGSLITNWRDLTPDHGDKVELSVVPQGPFLAIIPAIIQVISAVVSVVQFFISLFNRPKAPKARAEHDSSPTYSFDGIRDSFSPGGAIPVVYGEHRMGGQVLTLFTERESSIGSNKLGMLLGLCEGVITDISCQSINGTALTAFPEATVDYRLGTSSQAPILGFESIQNTFADGRPLASGPNGPRAFYDPGTPIIYSTQGDNIRAVTIYVVARGGLYVQYGGSHPRQGGHSIMFQVEKRVQGSTAWDLVGQYQMNGQTRSAVWLWINIQLDHADAWDFRLQWIQRYEAEGSYSVEFVQDDLNIDSVTEIPEISDPQSTEAHSGTALLALRAVATAQLHGGRPNVTTMVKGRSVRAYSDTVTYVETWTANPAWCVLDYMTNSIYGMGAWITTNDVDMQSFIDFATLCDSQVPNGAGGWEEQHRLDLVMDARKPHWSWVQDILGLYRSDIINSNGKWKIISDRADLPLRQVFHAGNTVPQKTQITITKDPLAPNQATIRFANKLLEYEQDVLYVTASGTAAGTPIKSFDMSLIGITRTSEALREAGWQMQRRRETRREIKFVTGLEGVVVERGDMARVGIVTTNYELGYGGRAMVGSSLSSVVCDREFEVKSGYPYEIFVWHTTANTPETRTLANTVSGGLSACTFIVAVPTSNFTYPVEVNDRWALGVTSEDLMNVRVKSVRRDPSGGHEITAEQFVRINPTTPSLLGKGMTFDLNGPCAQPISAVTTVVFQKMIDGSKIALGMVEVSPAPRFQGGLITAAGCATVIWLGGSHAPITDALIGDGLRMVSGVSSSTAWSIITSYSVSNSGKLATVSPALAAAPNSGDDYMIGYRTPAFLGFDLYSQPSTIAPSDDKWTIFGTYVGGRAEWSDDTTSRSLLWKIVPFTENSVRNTVGTWVVSMTAIADSTCPQDVQDYSVSQVGGSMLHTWTPVEDSDLSHYEIREGSTWETANTVEDQIFRTHFEMQSYVPGNHNFLIKAVDRSDNESADATEYEVHISEAELRGQFVLRDEIEQLTGVFSGTTALVVGSVTNQLRHSGQIDGWANSPSPVWLLLNGFYTYSDSAGVPVAYTDPFNNLNARKMGYVNIISPHSAQSVFVNTATLVQTSALYTQSKDLTFSVWLKSAGFNAANYAVEIRDSFTPLSHYAQKYITVGKSWERVDVSGGFTGAASGYAYAVLTNRGLNTAPVYVWGAQLETGLQANRYVNTTSTTASDDKLALGLESTETWDAPGAAWDAAGVAWDQGIGAYGTYTTEALDFNRLSILRSQMEYRWFDREGDVTFSAALSDDGLLFSDYKLLGAGDESAKVFKVQMALTAANTGSNPRIDQWMIHVDAQRRAWAEEVAVTSAGGTNVTFNPKFLDTPTLDARTTTASRIFVISSLDAYGFNVKLFDISSTSIPASGSVIYQVAGI
jgi:hypothetical protein